MQFKCHSGFVRYIFPNIPNKLEPNILGPVLVRFETNTKRTGGLFGSAAFEPWLCSVRGRTEQTEQALFGKPSLIVVEDVMGVFP